MENQNDLQSKREKAQILRQTIEAQDWDRLDSLLEQDSSLINEKSVYTDTWGEYWGFLLECVYRQQVLGVRILLKHGAKKTVGNWGDCLPTTPLEEAQRLQNQEIIALLQARERPTYQRKDLEM
ncbi:hypothetical protein [Hugenholtzia roseola]|uniref:hypothetical protein n=1 Tax=Hugenholtzia roseola TaxID=1002 RepID=UPI000479BBDB|nr:hypothetical protein [Hugenholtzia roseola]